MPSQGSFAAARNSLSDGQKKAVNSGPDCTIQAANDPGIATALIFGRAVLPFYDTEVRHGYFSFLLRKHHEIYVKEVCIFP